jgi:hypothetical protein
MAAGFRIAITIAVLAMLAYVTLRPRTRAESAPPMAAGQTIENRFGYMFAAGAFLAWLWWPT